MKKFRFTENLEVAISRQAISMDVAENKSEPVTSITPTVEAIHSIITKNKTFYPEDELLIALETWTSPHPKPILINHNWWSGDPVGRVKKAEFAPSQILIGSNCIKLILNISNKDTIEKVLDGRYLTMSIGASANKVICSICNTNLVESGMCSHHRGRKYEGKECFWTIGGLEFEEISFVSIPADPNAQVIVKNHTEGGDETVKESAIVDLSDLEALIAVGEQNVETLHVTESVSQQAETQTAPPSDKGMQPEIDKLSKQIEGLQNTIQELISAKESLSEENIKLGEKIVTLQKETTEMHAQNIRIATSAHRLMAEHVVNLEIMLNEITMEQKIDRTNELIRLKSSVLKTKSEELIEKRPRRQMPTVSSPGAAIPSAGDVAEDTKDLTSPKTKTLADLAEVATSILIRKQ